MCNLAVTTVMLGLVNNIFHELASFLMISIFFSVMYKLYNQGHVRIVSCAIPVTELYSAPLFCYMDRTLPQLLSSEISSF